MKRVLGKIALAILILNIELFAYVSATVDRATIYENDPLTLTLEASGEDIEFPNIDEIGGFSVLGRSEGRSITILNSSKSVKRELRLTFAPNRPVTIPSYSIKVNGQIEKTKPINIKVLKPQAAPDGASMQLIMRSSKKEVYVGEPFRFDLVFKQKQGVRIDDIRITPPSFENFWAEPINTKPIDGIDKDGYITKTFSYILFAQQSGSLDIPATVANIGIRTARASFFSSGLNYKKVYTDGVEILAKPLPNNIQVYGDFKLQSSIDKSKVKASRPINLKIMIEGYGNVDEIEKFEPVIDGALVYADEPKTEGFVRNGRYYGKFTQNIAIILDKNSTIAPMEFKYFDSKTEKVVTKLTREYKIEVEGAIKQQPLHTQSMEPIKATEQTQSDSKNSYDIGALALSFFLGFAIGALSLYLFLAYREDRTVKPKTEEPELKRLKQIKDDRSLLAFLLPYRHRDSAIDEALEILESNIYGRSKKEVNMEALVEYFSSKKQKIELI